MSFSGTLPKTVLHSDEGRVLVAEILPGRRKISLEAKDPELRISRCTCETSYPVELIEKVFRVTGLAWLCDELQRDEAPEYLKKSIECYVLTYVAKEDFKNKRVLDFGCGGGASSMVLARMFPGTEIVGVELSSKLVSIAKSRAKFYKLDNVTFHASPTPNSLPNNIGKFDYVIMTAVYEHLLPEERKTLLPQLWSVLKAGGVLFLHNTPQRYAPIDVHTTGLPFINYLPDKWALFYAQKYSKRNLADEDWQGLLRRGIRGGTISEILNNLAETGTRPTLLSPSMNGTKDRVDIWWLESQKGGHVLAKKVVRVSLKALKAVSGIEALHYLALAIKKNSVAATTSNWQHETKSDVSKTTLTD